MHKYYAYRGFCGFVAWTYLSFFVCLFAYIQYEVNRSVRFQSQAVIKMSLIFIIRIYPLLKTNGNTMEIDKTVKNPEFCLAAFTLLV